MVEDKFTAFVDSKSTLVPFRLVALRVVADEFTVFADCTNRVVPLMFVEDKFTALANCKNPFIVLKFVALRFVADKLGLLLSLIPPNIPFTYNVLKLALVE